MKNGLYYNPDGELTREGWEPIEYIWFNVIVIAIVVVLSAINLKS